MSAFAEFRDFPLRDTLGGGLYHPDEHYLGGGSERLFFGHCPTRPEERYLISTSPDNGLALEIVRDKLMRPAPGVFGPLFVGHFDVLGDDPVRDRHRTRQCAFVEKLPDGGPLSRVVSDPRPQAAALGHQIGSLLSSAVKASNVYVVGLRPEYVWARIDGVAPIVTGIGGRNGPFFASAARKRDLPTVPLFTRRYTAPEVTRRQPYDDRALVLTLAVMVAEWATGEYPYPGGDGKWGYNNLVAGKHRELNLPAELARLLSMGMRPDPGARPDLAAFTEQLRDISLRAADHSDHGTSSSE